MPTSLAGPPYDIEMSRGHSESVGAILEDNRDLSDVIKNFLILFLPMLAFTLFPTHSSFCRLYEEALKYVT